MDYILALLSIWLLFIGCAMKTKNTKSLLMLKMPCFIFFVFTGLYSLKLFGILSLTI